MDAIGCRVFVLRGLLRVFLPVHRLQFPTGFVRFNFIDRNLLSGRCAVQGELLLRRIHWK